MTTPDRIYRTVFTVEVFSSGPYGDADLAEIAHDIMEGDCTGNYFMSEQEIVDPDKVASELERIGTDPGFFGEDYEDDFVWDSMEHVPNEGFCAKCGGDCEYLPGGVG